MYRLAVFVAGLAMAATTSPTVLDHHARAELLQSAWCLSGGSDASVASILSWHCPACPALLAGIALMALSPFANRLPKRLLQGRSKVSQA